MLVDPALSPKRIYNLLSLLLNAMTYKNVSDFGLSMPKTIWLTQEDGVYTFKKQQLLDVPRREMRTKHNLLVTVHAGNPQR